MKKSAGLALLTTVSPLALLVGGSADAADLGRPALKAPPPAPPVYSWTGCYAGAHVGWGWGQNRFTQASFSNGALGTGSSGQNPGSGSFTSSGALFGGQVGCRYQFSGWSPWAGSNWVIGAQGDFAGTDFNGKGFDNFGLGNTDINRGSNIVALKTDWLASATVSLGLTAFNNQALFYVKGGAAWIHNKWDLSQTTTPEEFTFFNGPLFDATRTGWTIGGGAEWTLWSPNWTAFVEYNFYDFDDSTFTRSFSCQTSSHAPCFQQFTQGRQTINTVKVGVNYKWW